MIFCSDFLSVSVGTRRSAVLIGPFVAVHKSCRHADVTDTLVLNAILWRYIDRGDGGGGGGGGNSCWSATYQSCTRQYDLHQSLYECIDLISPSTLGPCQLSPSCNMAAVRSYNLGDKVCPHRVLALVKLTFLNRAPAIMSWTCILCLIAVDRQCTCTLSLPQSADRSFNHVARTTMSCGCSM